MHGNKEAMTYKCMNWCGYSSIGGDGLYYFAEATVVVVDVGTVFGEVGDGDLTVCFFGWRGIGGCAGCVFAWGACLGQSAQC